MEWQVKLQKVVRQCSSQFVSGSTVRVPVCVRALLRQTRCSDDFFLALIVTLFSRFVRVNFSTYVNDTHLFVALNDHWIEETISFKNVAGFPSSDPRNHLSERT